eukprot:sb/3479470/
MEPPPPDYSSATHKGAEAGYNPGYPPGQAGYPPGQAGYPPGQGGYPPGQGGYAGYSQPGAEYPPGGYPPQTGGYPPAAGAAYPLQGYPPTLSGYVPTIAGYPPAAGGYPPQPGVSPHKPGPQYPQDLHTLPPVGGDYNNNTGYPKQTGQGASVGDLEGGYDSGSMLRLGRRGLTDKIIRRAFIRKVYMILCLQFAVTVGAIFLVRYVVGQGLLSSTGNMILTWTCFAIFFIAEIVLVSIEELGGWGGWYRHARL